MMTDAELVAAIRQGDREAFGEFVARHQRMVEAVAFAAAGQPELIDDVVQDTFIAAWRGIDRMAEPDHARAWLCGIARNTARKARRRRRDVPADTRLASTPFEQFSDHERDRELAAALGKLPARYREPLVLFYYEQRSVKDIAAALALREDAVMQRLTRGRRQLGDQLERVERDLERRPSRAALAVVILALLPVRAASASTMAWPRVAGALLACGGIAAVMVVGTQRSQAVAAKAATKAPSSAPAAPAPARAPAPALPASRDAHLYHLLAPASFDSYETCRRGARALAMAALAPNALHTVDGKEVYDEPSPEIRRTADVAAERTAATCGGDHWPELYVMCEGTLSEILDGTASCYPWDPFA
jgi:RNA polymerase sigma factor (sigma-70 family)